MKYALPGAALLALLLWTVSAGAGSYPVVDTGQTACFNNSRQMTCPDPGDDFNGQDAQYKGNQPHYIDNGDGTVSDLVTGLMWVKARGEKMSWSTAMDGASECRVGGYTDWRAPTIKELYSLINFMGWSQATERASTPFIDTRYFEFEFGDTSRGGRIIDCQDWSSTEYVSRTMGGQFTIFGVNFADGRIKGYPKRTQGHSRNSQGYKYMRYVRGNPQYGQNAFVAKNNGTVADMATGLVWQQKDSGKGMNWESALAYCENLNLAGQSDWRLPSAKELQSIVDYTRSPKTTGSAAIDPKFFTTSIEGWYWASTTHMDGPQPNNAVYVAFGRAMGYFSPPRSNQSKQYLDVHGAGAQRSDPKSGSPSRYAGGHGPQGDEVRINNSVRCVRGGGVAYYEPPATSLPRWQGRGNPNERGSTMGNGMVRGNEGRMDHNQGQGMYQQPSMQDHGMMQGQPPMQGGQQGQRMGQGPPQEAFDACDGLAANSECSVTTPRGTLEGICRDMPEGRVCVPAHGPGGGMPRQ